MQSGCLPASARWRCTRGASPSSAAVRCRKTSWSRLPGPERVASELCLIFATAPASYWSFSLRFDDNFCLQIYLAEPGGRLQSRQGLSAAVKGEVLADHMQDRAVGHGMSVAVVEELRGPSGSLPCLKRTCRCGSMTGCCLHLLNSCLCFAALVVHTACWDMWSLHR